MRGGSLARAAGLVIVLSASTAAASGDGVSDNQLWDLLYRIINFAVLAGILIFLLKKPFKSGLKGRSKAIADELKDLESKRDEARRAYAMMERRLLDIEKEREDVLARFKEDGEREKKKILDDAQLLAERIKGQAQHTIEHETKLAKAELRREVAEMSAEVAEKLVREKITQKDQSRLVDEYLDKVGQKVH